MTTVSSSISVREILTSNSQCLLLIGRLRLDPHLISTRAFDGARCWLLLQRPRTQKVGFIPNMAIDDEHRRRQFPMVLLGLLSHI